MKHLESPRMVGEGEPKKDLTQQVGGFLVESRMGRGVQRFADKVKFLLKPVRLEEKRAEFERDVKIPLTTDVELQLWDAALDLPDSFWQRQLDALSNKPKPEDPTKSLN